MTGSTTFYKDDKHYLLDRLRLLDNLLRRAVQRARASGNDGDPLRGLYISDKDADLLLEERTPQSLDLSPSSSKAPEVRAVKASVGAREQRMALRAGMSPGSGGLPEPLASAMPRSRLLSSAWQWSSMQSMRSSTPTSRTT